MARRALERSGVGPAGALEAAETVLVAAERYRKALTASLKDDLAPFLDDAGQPEEAYRGAVRRLEERHKRRVRRAERDYVDWVLLAASAILRDRVVAAVGGGGELLMNPDITPAAEPRPGLGRRGRSARRGARRARRGAEPERPSRGRAGVPAAGAA